MTTSMRPKPLALIILDGFGAREEAHANAIHAANKPNWDKLTANYPYTLISGSGKCVGLPVGQMGNSEVGHLNMGAGRIVEQDLTRIDMSIEDGSFFKNAAFIEAFSFAKKNKRAVHVMGLLSPGGVHSYDKHIHALVLLAGRLEIKNVYLHLFLDGRDTPPKSAAAYIASLQQTLNKTKTGYIASLSGRYYAMDRDRRWERTQQTYDLLTLGASNYHAISAESALNEAYLRGETDEFVKTTAIHAVNENPITVNDGDSIIFMNYRSDRARQLTQPFVDSHFTGFERKKFPMLHQFICLTEYDPRFNAVLAYQPLVLSNILATVLSEHGLTQLRIAETEKYAHVTFFFNGGVEIAYPHEDRILIPSPKIATYDLQPEMSAPELTERLIKEINKNHYDVIICNFANADMVGHTGDFDATVKAIEVLDDCIGKIIGAIKKVGGEVLITADHGNAEMMFDLETNQPHTAHTSDPVPFLYIGRPAEIIKECGKLSDIAPTILYLLGISPPNEMTGSSLIKLE